MFREFFMLLLLGHVLGDFYIQTTKMAEKKVKSLAWVFIHCACYFGMVLVVGLPMLSVDITFVAILAAGSHLVIDIAKFFYLSSYKRKRIVTHAKVTYEKIPHEVERNAFFFDQLLHVICIIAIAYWMVQNNTVIVEFKVVEEFFDVIGLSESLVVSWLLALLLIHKPANIAIAKLLVIYKPTNTEEEKWTTNNAGRFIGTVERIIMLIFLSIGQFSAIGLVLTAKSIARYDRITKELAFAEYYLLGTLLSTLLVVLASFLL